MTFNSTAEDKLYSQIFSLYGNITRARGFFLYTQKNVRLVDMFQEAGRAILGWGSTCGAFTIFKNVLNRGLTGSFITAQNGQLNKAVSTLLESKRTVFSFCTKQNAVNALIEFGKESNCTYKPFIKNGVDYKNIEAVLLEPPFPCSQKIYLIAVKNPSNKITTTNETRLSGALCSGICRSIYNLIAKQKLLLEKDWFIYDTILTKYWTRQGPYLTPKIPQEKYDDFVLHCLKQNLVISPYFNTPSIVPVGVDFNVFKNLKNNSFEF